MYERVTRPASSRFSSLAKLMLGAVGLWLLWSGVGSISENLFQDAVVTPSPAVSTVVIPTGASVEHIASLLTDAQVIDQPWLFKIYVQVRRYGGRLQAGTYTLDHGTSIRRVVNRLLSGQEDSEVQVTLIEGWTAAQYADRLSYALLPGTATSNFERWQQEFMQQLQRAYDYDWLASKPASVDLEGYLFPDTYRFRRRATPDEIIPLLLENFARRVTPEIRAAIAEQGKTLHQVVTLASIIEREVQTPADRRLVADIFWRRLAADIPLQADSTVNYVTGKKDPAVSAADKAVDSLYNTYRYPGLPPGPISNPGLDAIQAAITPEANDAWYFLTTADGTVIYSRTLQEQAAAKAKYLR